MTGTLEFSVLGAWTGLFFGILPPTPSPRIPQLMYTTLVPAVANEQLLQVCVCGAWTGVSTLVHVTLPMG